MPSQTVHFRFRPGLAASPFTGVRLCGSWDAEGHPALDWTEVEMRPGVEADGYSVFDADVAFPDDAIGTTFHWGVKLDGPAGTDQWGVAAEVEDPGSNARVRALTLAAGLAPQRYALSWLGRLGAVRLPRGDKPAGIRFSVWAPTARAVDLVLADPAHCYVADDGTGAVATIPMKGDGGFWCVETGDDPALGDFASLLGKPYMFGITKEGGAHAYRTDLWSLAQAGHGKFNPGGKPYSGKPADLDGPQSCSIVCDPNIVTDGETAIPAEAFWADEFDPGRPLPTAVEDLVIYELHVGALGFGQVGPGTFDDALAFVAHLATLGVNAVELMPVAEFEGAASWGYGSSHFFTVDGAAGGTDKLKMFVKACHQRGIAVILDVCYNHYTPDGERAEWAYDSDAPENNVYYWYEGRPSDYSEPDGGYIDNVSSGWAPRFSEEAVRQMFIASAAHLVQACHVDGFRLDQTSSIHQYPAIHADGRSANRAAASGVKFLRQWTRTMRLIKPGLFLSAEDYSDWSAMTQPSLDGDGLGFDATWYGDFHHNLIEYKNGNQAQLLRQAGFGGDGPLAMSAFAGALKTSRNAKVVYSESHDDCGNREGSARAIVIAVDGAALVGDTRVWAEARVRFAAGMNMLSAGTPMFFMGEEVGAAKPYRYDDFVANREDILGLAEGDGAKLFGFYQDLIALSVEHSAIRSRNIDVLAADDSNRVIAFHRADASGAYVVAGSLNNSAFAHGYWLHGDPLGDATWVEVFNSDAERYGGWNVGNAGRTIQARNGAIDVVLPACGFVVLRRT